MDTTAAPHHVHDDDHDRGLQFDLGTLVAAPRARPLRRRRRCGRARLVRPRPRWRAGGDDHDSRQRHPRRAPSPPAPVRLAITDEAGTHVVTTEWALL